MNKNCINWKSINEQIEGFGRRPPFDFVVLDNFFKEDIAHKLQAEFPAFDSEIWHKYNNAIEVKKVCNNWNEFPETTYSVFSYLNSVDFLEFLSQRLLSGLKLYSDNGLNGGGWHAHKKGGKLNTHLDYSLHPKLELQRKLNIIIYLNPNWREEWGGALGFWGNESSEKPGDLITSVSCKFNRAVIFDTTQNSWHGLPEPLLCPEGEVRQSLAAYFLCDPPENINERGKALFAPSADQIGNREIIELIKKRANVDTAAAVYKND